jgi:hypothetical protein
MCYWAGVYGKLKIYFLIGAIIGATLLCSAVGEGIFFLIKKLWDRHNTKALDKLEKILIHLARIQDANFVFQKYMLKSEEATNEMLTDLNGIKKGLTANTRRYRSANIPVCDQAIESTKKMIETIENIESLKIDEWSRNELLSSNITGQLALTQ